VTQGRVLDQQIAPRFQGQCGEANHETKPMDHGAEASAKSDGGLAFYCRMALLPTTPSPNRPPELAKTSMKSVAVFFASLNP
jgi:hypothetical protein